MSRAEQSSGGAPRRGFGSTGDMVRSTLVVLAIVIGIFALVPRPGFDSVREVDVERTASEARAAASYDVVAPAGLAAGWRATVAQFQRRPDGTSTWRIGYVTPDDDYVRLAQSDQPAESFVVKETVGAIPEGSRSVAGETWQQVASTEQGQRALWLAAEGSTVVLTGTAPYDALAELAASLQGGGSSPPRGSGG